jgi:hypothetical protein
VVAAGVVAVREQDEHAAGEVLALELVDREQDPVVEGGALLRVDGEFGERRVRVDRGRRRPRERVGAVPEGDDGDEVAGAFLGDERARGRAGLGERLTLHRP